MNNKPLVALILVAVAALSFLGGSLLKTPSLGAAFSGGVTPSQLFTANPSTTSVSPISGAPNLLLTGLLSIGGIDQYHQITSYNNASGTPATVITLGPLGSTTSTATTTITLPDTVGLSVGAICSGGAATTTLYVSGCVLASTNNATGTATVAYSNITSAAISVPTSTRLNVTFDQLPY